ncbi:MAG: electron transfer flavoprotein subunit beta/FixA family protein [Thermoplasmata archaeon]
MQIQVLVKPVPEAESRLRPAPDGTGLDPDGIKWVLGGYDESAVEQALLLKEQAPGTTVRVVTFGPAPRSEEVLRAGLALGCDQATWVERPEGGTVGGIDAARALAGALASRPAELVLLGRQSGDSEEGLQPLALAALLGRPGFGAVSHLHWDGSRNGFTFRRALDLGSEEWTVPAPVVLGLQQADNDPRTAKLPMILKSRKMPIERVPAAEVAAFLQGHPRAEPFRFSLPSPRTGAKLIEYASPEEAAEKLLRRLREEAKVLQ